MLQVKRRLGVTWSVIWRLCDRLIRLKLRISFNLLLASIFRKGRKPQWKSCAVKVKCGDLFSQRVRLSRAINFSRLKWFSPDSDTSKTRSLYEFSLRVKLNSKGAKCEGNKKKIMSLHPSVAFSLKITNTLHFKSQSNFYSCLKTGYKNLNPTLTFGVEYR